MEVMDAVFDVFGQVAGWFPSIMQEIAVIFYTPAQGENPGELTFFGILALCGLAFSIVFLVIGLISNFLHFRG